MKNFIKQLISLILPISVLLIIPYWIEKDISIKNIPVFVAGLFLMCLGLSVVVITISKFIRIGKGTLAPWSPTKKLVISGIYGHIRNPMILGVFTAIIGESVAILSLKILIWAIIFFIINNIYFMIFEEPGMVKRFGDEYKEYKKNVPRWIPRLKPYLPDSKLK